MNSANLLDDIKIVQVAAAAASAGTEVTGDTLDMGSYDGVIFFATIATANAGNYLKAKEGATSPATTDIAGSKVVAGTNGDVVLLEVHKPLKRYITASIIRAGTNTATGDLFAILYKARKAPKSSDDVAVKLVSPAAGTP